jgi:hypothetical protein
MTDPPVTEGLKLYYHCAVALLQSGERIHPGNWGRVVLGIGPDHPLFYREYLWERIRREEFQDRPSRMRAAFAFDTHAAAQTYKAQEQGKARDHVYAVQLASPQDRWIRADMSWISVVRQYRTFEGAEGCARSYWRGDVRDPNSIELLVEGDLVVMDRLTPIGENGTA